MWYIIIAGFLLIGVLFGSGFLSCTTANQSENNNKNIIDSLQGENDTIKGMFSREQIDKKLKHLAETPAPTKLSFGAACYDMALIQNTVLEYVCGRH